MAETIIKYNKPKENKRGGYTYISSSRALYGDSVTTSANTTNITANTLWQTSQGNGSLIPSGSNNIAAGTNSVAIGTNTQTTNEGELAIGEYNKSTEGMTLFSVGDGTSEEDRHNVFEVDYTGFTASNGVIEGNLQAAKGIFDNAKVNGLLDTNQLKAISGYIQTLLSDEITCDYLTVTKAAHFFKLIIDEIKATQGAVIITPANAVLDKVDTISGGWRCYYRAKDDDGRQIYNCFEVNDQVVCQTFDAATGTSYNVSNQWYWRKVTATGTTTTTINGSVKDVHYFDLSSTDCDRYSMTPKVGDNCVQLGNRTDTTRQAAIIISAYNSQFLDKGLKAPSIVQYAGINDYDLSKHRLNIISNGLNQFKGSYNNNNGQDIETIISTTASTLDGKITALNGTVTSHTQSISELKQTDESIKSTVSANTTSIGTLSNRLDTVSGTVTSNSTNIATLQQTANGLTSTVESHTTSITTINNNVSSVSGDVNTLSDTVSTNSTNIATLQQTANGLTSTVESHTTSITTLNNNVSSVSDEVNSLSDDVDSLSDDVTTIKQDYVTSSELNQTATSITSTVAATYVTKTNFNHDINSLEDDINDIKSDYVTSSEIKQTASSITASVTENIEGKLSQTGIDITAHKITLSSDNTEFKSSSGAKTWLVGKDASGDEIFKLGRYGNNEPYLRLADNHDSWTGYTTYGYDSLYINGGNSVNASIYTNSSETEIKLQNGYNCYVLAGVNSSGYPSVKLNKGSYSVQVWIDSSGKLHIKPSGKSMWINEDNRSSTSSGEIYVDNNGFLKINNWS